MAEYRKYMFDNFVIEKITKSEELSVTEPETEDVEEISEEAEIFEDVEEIKEELVVEAEEISSIEIEDEPVIMPEQTEIVEDNLTVYEPNEPTYSQEEFDNAVSQAEKDAYEKGYKAAEDENIKKQNLLLDDIKNQLMTIFADLDNKTSGIESSSLKFAVALVRKILPTLEKERAEAEVKNFLSENFANFVVQDSLSFAFHPDTIAIVANSLGRLAEQNDFEGKISVHKDTSLGLSDCRVEWKNGGVERSTSKVLGKIETIIEDDIREREHG